MSDMKKSNFHASILTSFPEMFPGSLNYSIAGDALRKNIWSLDVIDIRDFGITKHKSIDDEAYGGNQGMVMRADVLGEALDFTIKKSGAKKIYYMFPR
jgi:tRNA (guanine37-N1)-methyltransferase